MPTFQQLLASVSNGADTTLSEIDYIHSSFTFPEKLFIILERDDNRCMEWVDNGLCFRIVDEDLLLSDVIPKYFKQTKMTSFQRQLNSYGFRKITRGSEFGCYFHPKFRKGQPQLLTQVQRLPRKGSLESYEEVKQSVSRANKLSFEVFPFSQKRVTVPPIHTQPVSLKREPTTKQPESHSIDNFLEDFLENFLEESSMTSSYSLSHSYGEDHRSPVSHSPTSSSSSHYLPSPHRSTPESVSPVMPPPITPTLVDCAAVEIPAVALPPPKRSYEGPYLFLGCNSRSSFSGAEEDYYQYQRFEQHCMSRLLQEFYYPQPAAFLVPHEDLLLQQQSPYF